MSLQWAVCGIGNSVILALCKTKKKYLFQQMYRFTKAVDVCVCETEQEEWSQHPKSASLWWVNCLKGGAACLSRVSLPTSRQSIVYEWKSWVVYLLMSHTSEPPPPPTPSEGKSELRDTQLEEWEEVLPSPPMLSDSPSSRTNLSTGGVLSLDSPLTWRNIRKLTFIRPPAVSLLPAVYKCVCFLIF